MRLTFTRFNRWLCTDLAVYIIDVIVTMHETIGIEISVTHGSPMNASKSRKLSDRVSQVAIVIPSECQIMPRDAKIVC
jgi:hypothetical protein